jgi:hypothetical protein
MVSSMETASVGGEVAISRSMAAIASSFMLISF